MFYQAVDTRSRSAMTAFLQDHPRYPTRNSWNGDASYSQCIKVPRLNLTDEQTSKAFDVLGLDELQGLISDVTEAFTEEHGGAYTIGSNGRSGGYLVLYASEYEDTGHKSRCCSCGQLNYRKVYAGPREGLEGAVAKCLMTSPGLRHEVYLSYEGIAALPESPEEKLAMFKTVSKAIAGGDTWSNKCGACGAEGEKGRKNLAKSPRRLKVSCKGIDDGHFSEMSMTQLRERVRLVQSFDKACDSLREEFIALLEYDVIEEVVMVPKTVRRLSCTEPA